MQKIVSALANFKPRRRGFSKNFLFELEEKVLQNETDLMLETDNGSIDLIGKLAGIDSYRQVFTDSLKLKLFGYEVRVLSLDDLIKAKKAANRPKDLFVLPQLETLRETLLKTKEE